MEGSFKKENNYEKRIEVSNRLRISYKERVPIIVECAKTANNINLKRKKYLAPENISVGAFLNEVRKHASISAEEAIFLFCGCNVLVPTNSSIVNVYNKYKDDDGFLYFTIANENTFGSFYYLNIFSTNFLDKILKSSSNLSSSIGL